MAPRLHHIQLYRKNGNRLSMASAPWLTISMRKMDADLLNHLILIRQAAGSDGYGQIAGTVLPEVAKELGLSEQTKVVNAQINAYPWSRH